MQHEAVEERKIIRCMVLRQQKERRRVQQLRKALALAKMSPSYTVDAAVDRDTEPGAVFNRCFQPLKLTV